MKDEYTSNADNSACYYIGGMDKCTFDSYDKKSKTSLITLPGVPDRRGITRSLEVTVHCINDAVKTEFECERVRRDTVDHYTYECDFYSEYGCPNYNPNPYEALSVIIIFLLLSCCVCGAVLLSIIVIVTFVMIKGRTPNLYNRVYDTPSLYNKDDLEELSGTSKYQTKHLYFKEEEKEPIKVKSKMEKKKCKKKSGKENLQEKKLVKENDENDSEVMGDKESQENIKNVKDMD